MTNQGTGNLSRENSWLPLKRGHLNISAIEASSVDNDNGAKKEVTLSMGSWDLGSWDDT